MKNYFNFYKKIVQIYFKKKKNKKKVKFDFDNQEQAFDHSLY